jgi:hypothetical protein
MQGLFGLVAMAVVASVGLLIGFERRRGRLRAWRAAAEAVGLTDVSEASVLGFPTRLEGRLGQLDVRFASYSRGKNEHGFRIEVRGLGHAGLVNIRAEGVGSQVAKAFGDREVAVGDNDFDRVAFIQGEPAMLRAVLGEDARRALGELLSGHFATASGVNPRTVRTTLSDSCLRVDIRDRAFDDVRSHLPEIARDLAAIGQMLTRPDDVAARLAEHARADPLASVRLLNLETLATEYPQQAVTRQALVSALDDHDSEVQLRAAIALGAEGREALLRLAGDAEVEESVSARAIGALGVDYSEDLAVERLRRAAESAHIQVAGACVARLAADGAARHVKELAALLSSSSPELGAAAASALGSAGGEEAEHALVDVLEAPPSEVRQAAVVSLGRIGTAFAVAPLHACAADHRLEPSLRSAIRQSVAEIQSRIAGASPGQLTLPPGEVGELSVAETDARGQVSLAAHAETPNLEGVSQDDGRRLQAQAARAQAASGGPAHR